MSSNTKSRGSSKLHRINDQMTMNAQVDVSK